MKTKAPKYLSTTLVKGMNLLAAFTYEKQSLNLSELAALTGIDKATCTRLASTFMHLGYIGRDANKKFYLEPRVLRFGFSYLNGSELKSVGENYLKKLSIEINYTANIAVLDDTDIVIIFRNEQGKMLRQTITLGARLPAFCTAQGKVLLAHVHESLAIDKFRRSEIIRYTDKTICSEDAFLEELEKIRRQGYGICDQEYDYSFSAVSAPIYGQEGDVVAAMSFVYQPQAIVDNEYRKLVDKTIETAEHISFLIGYVPKGTVA